MPLLSLVVNPQSQMQPSGLTGNPLSVERKQSVEHRHPSNLRFTRDRSDRSLEIDRAEQDIQNLMMKGRRIRKRNPQSQTTTMDKTED